MKRDIRDDLWVPLLAANQAANMIEDLLKGPVRKKPMLPMRKYPEEHGYPRPKLVRKSYLSLDGMWQLAPNQSEKRPEHFPRQVRVPYAPQASVLGRRGFDPGDEFWYRKMFTLPEGFVKDRLLLHLGAVDQICRVYVNGVEAGSHEGGYLPFVCDITDLVQEGTNELTVYVKDTLDHRYPYGKQTKKPEGMWYTEISGIWQSVWLESVPRKHVENICCRMVEDGVEITLEGTADHYDVTIFQPAIEEGEIGTAPLVKVRLHNGVNTVAIPNPRLWSPEHPYIYRMKVRAGNDWVQSYFTLRTITIEWVNGRKWMCLNHKPYFFHGVLDQGYFSEGIYTPVSDRYYEDDIRNMKCLGYNTLRKHIKVEPEVFYYACDRIGMLVFQDMVNNGDYNYLRDTLSPTLFDQWKYDRNWQVAADVKEMFISHSLETIAHLKKYGCIVLYTVFNEGWGQFNSTEVTRILRQADPDRLYDSTSGWFKQLDLDVEIDSDHVYFHKIHPNAWTKRPVLISECGGFTGVARKHSISPDKVYGYGSCHTREELTARIRTLYIEEVIPNIRLGINGVIYTQLSDVEEETNGIYTYDRAVCKVVPDQMRELADHLTHELYRVTDQLD